MDVIFQTFEYLIAFFSASLAQWQLFSHFNFKHKIKKRKEKACKFFRFFKFNAHEMCINEAITQIQTIIICKSERFMRSEEKSLSPVYLAH